MQRNNLIEEIRRKGSYLCVGLDSDITKIPLHLKGFPDPVLEFNRRIIEATLPYAVAYKINTAFYESRGLVGWKCLEDTLALLPDNVLKIADAKRGDIGNTGQQYAKAFFEALPFDAVTVAPYMGKDSVTPFLEHKDKWTILLALTSNPGAGDFQLKQAGEKRLFEEVLSASMQWGRPDNLMFVVGATRPEELAHIRSLAPEHFFLVPGVGAQGGDLRALSQAGLTKDCGLLVNASRSIIFADSSENFAEAAAREAKKLQEEMSGLLASAQ